MLNINKAHDSYCKGIFGMGDPKSIKKKNNTIIPMHHKFRPSWPGMKKNN